MNEKEKLTDDPEALLADARAAIKAEQDRRLKRAGARLEAVLREEGCILDAVPVITPDGRLGARVELRLAAED